MTIYRVTTDHTATSDALESTDYLTARDAWNACATDYGMSDHGANENRQQADANRMNILTWHGEFTTHDGITFTVTPFAPIDLTDPYRGTVTVRGTIGTWKVDRPRTYTFLGKTHTLAGNSDARCACGAGFAVIADAPHSTNGNRVSVSASPRLVRAVIHAHLITEH